MADFGVSKDESTAGPAETTIGTPYWMAPEVFRNGTYNSKADLWSMGITCIEMALGRPPHSDKPPLQVIFLIPKADPPNIPEEYDEFSDDFRDFISHCLIKDPAKRPTATELLKHKWIKAGKTLTVMREWVLKCLPLLEKFRDSIRDEQLADDEEYDEEEDDDYDDMDDGFDDGTMINPGASYDDDNGNDEMEYGTMLIANQDDEEVNDDEIKDEEMEYGTMLIADTNDDTNDDINDDINDINKPKELNNTEKKPTKQAAYDKDLPNYAYPNKNSSNNSNNLNNSNNPNSKLQTHLSTGDVNSPAMYAQGRSPDGKYNYNYKLKLKNSHSQINVRSSQANSRKNSNQSNQSTNSNNSQQSRFGKKRLSQGPPMRPLPINNKAPNRPLPMKPTNSQLNLLKKSNGQYHLASAFGGMAGNGLDSLKLDLSTIENKTEALQVKSLIQNQSQLDKIKLEEFYANQIKLIEEKIGKFD